MRSRLAPLLQSLRRSPQLPVGAARAATATIQPRRNPDPPAQHHVRDSFRRKRTPRSRGSRRSYSRYAAVRSFL